MINLLCFIFLGTFGWGGSLFLIKILLVSLSPDEIVLYRMAIGALSLFLLAKLLKIKVNNPRALLFDGVVVGAFNMTIPCYLITHAELFVTSSLGSVINGLTPAMTFVIGVAFFRSGEKVSFINIISLLLGFVGILVVNSDVMLTQGAMWGVFALVGACIAYGVNANYFKYYARTKEPILVAAMASLVSALIMLVVGISSHSSLHWNLPTTTGQLMAILWLGIIGTGLSLFVYCLLIKRVGAVFASMITYLMTVTGIVMGVLFLHESISFTQMLGSLLIIGSLVLYNHAIHIQNVLLSWFGLVIPRSFWRAG